MATKTFNQYIEEINKLPENYAGNASQYQRTLTLAAYSAIIRNSPVDSGRYRGNHFISVGVPSDEVTDDIRDPQTALSSEQVKLKPQNVKPGVDTNISNNLPYSGVIEDGSVNREPMKVYAVSIRQALDSQEAVNLKNKGFTK